MNRASVFGCGVTAFALFAGCDRSPATAPSPSTAVAATPALGIPEPIWYVHESDLVLRSATTWTDDERQIIARIDAHFAFDPQADALYSIHHIPDGEGGLTGIWSVMVYPVTQKNEDGSFSSPGFRQAMVLRDGTITGIKEFDYRSDGRNVRVFVKDAL